MTTMNISIPESMKAFVEEEAASGEFTASEYVRHLIRMAQEERKREKRAQIAQYLALCEQQIAQGKCKPWDGEKFRKEMEAAYKKRSVKSKKS